MLFVSDVKSNKLINNKDNSELFGIEKLNLQDLKFRQLLMLLIQLVFRLFIKILMKFFIINIKIMKCPLIVNTSFNVRGEPIVCSPSDAFKCFMGTDLDVLVIGNFI